MREAGRSRIEAGGGDENNRIGRGNRERSGAAAGGSASRAWTCRSFGQGLELEGARIASDVGQRNGWRAQGFRKLFRKIASGLEALVRVALERTFEPEVEGLGQVRPETTRHRKLRRRDCREGHRNALIRVPDRAARETFVGHAAERPKVG